MRTSSILPLLLTTLAGHGVVALRSGKWCFSGCELNINYVNFNDTASGSKKVRSCQSKLRAASLYLCLDEYCSLPGREEWLQGVNETCWSTANVSLPPFHLIAEYTPERRARVARLAADEALTFPVKGEVVLPTEAFFDRAFTTLDAAYFEEDIHRLYGWVLYYFWAVVIAIGAGNRLLCLIRSTRGREWHLIPRATNNRIPRQLRILGRVSAFVKAHITTPATFNNRCARPFGWCTVPPRIQSLTIFSFVLLNIILCTANYRVTHGNLYWPDEGIQLWRFVSDRTGILSLANFPLIWLFGTRNNVLMWMTGWGFGSFNNFHRWVARVSTVQAIVHSVGYTVMIHERGGWRLFSKYLHKHYFWNGEVATVGMCALLAFSVYGLRRSHYEVFLVSHIILSIIVLLTMYYHVEIFVSGEWNIFIYPCLAIWIFDRILRGLRILIFSPCWWNTKATATYDEALNLVRLDIPSDRSSYNPAPGTYYYIYLLNDLLFAHQNHPFTLAYVNPIGKCRRTDVPLLRTNSTDSTESDALLLSSRAHSTDPSLTFLIRPYDGFTSRLARKASLALTSLRVIVEGPYGQTLPLHEYPNILFLVGGTGIAVPLSYLSHILSSASVAVNIRIVWAVRELAFLSSILREFEGMMRDERVRLVVHVTRDDEAKDDLLVQEGNARVAKIEVGRPDVGMAAEESAKEAGHERLAIIACGPGGMADETRKACVELLGRGHVGLDYLEESFQW